jgi:integrase
MATAYLKNGKLYIGYMDATIGRQRCERAPVELGVDKELGVKLAEKLEDKLRAQAEIVGKNAGPLTVRRWFADWAKRRKDEGISSADDDEARIRIHVLQPNPWFADMTIDEVRRRHAKQILSKLKAKVGTTKDKIGSRTLRNIWAALSSMFEDAVDSEIITANPCKLKRGSLPKRTDKNVKWRSTAIFTRREIEQIFIDDRIPWDRRMFYATCFFAGAGRFGEAAARRWRDYDRERTPLGAMKIETSYCTKTKTEKPVKTEVQRAAPVHPVYAALLAEWRLSGWEQLMGRAPTDDDLIVPSRRGVFRNANHMLHRFHEDLERIGLRTRRQHDLRRTFISLCREDGANKELLRWITHGVAADVMDTYTTPTWESLCSQVSCLKLDLRRGEVIALPKAAAGGGSGGEASELPPAPHAGGRDKESNADGAFHGENVAVTTLLPAQASRGFEGSQPVAVAADYTTPIAALHTDDHRKAARSSSQERFRVPSAPRLNPATSGPLRAREYAGRKRPVARRRGVRRFRLRGQHDDGARGAVCNGRVQDAALRGRLLRRAGAEIDLLHLGAARLPADRAVVVHDRRPRVPVRDPLEQRDVRAALLGERDERSAEVVLVALSQAEALEILVKAPPHVVHVPVVPAPRRNDQVLGTRRAPHQPLPALAAPPVEHA